MNGLVASRVVLNSSFLQSNFTKSVDDSFRMRLGILIGCGEVWMRMIRIVLRCSILM